MSDSRREKGKKEEEEVGRSMKGQWATSKVCRDTSFVNCSFGESGACQTLGHIRRG